MLAGICAYKYLTLDCTLWQQNLLSSLRTLNSHNTIQLLLFSCPQPTTKSFARLRVLLLYPTMTPVMEPSIDSLTYTYDDLRSHSFYLDRLLDRMAPVFSIDDSTPPIKELGALTVLPAELLLMVVENLTVVDLMRFRRCNRFASYFVDTIPQLRTVLRIAPNTVKGIMALEVSTHITVKQLCQKIYQRECDGCGRLAQCIYLPTCLRICLRCSRTNETQYFDEPAPEDELRMNYGMSSAQLAVLPSFRPPLCTFTNGMNKFKTAKRHKLYDIPTSLLSEKLGWGEWFPPLLDPTLEDSTIPNIINRAIDDIDMILQKPNRENVTVVHDPLNSLLRKNMAIVIAPWPDATGLKAEQGVFCSTCVGMENQEAFYTRETFLEHLKDCRVAPQLLDSSDPEGSLVDSLRPLLWLCDDSESGGE